MTNFNGSYGQGPYGAGQQFAPSDYPGKNLGLVAMILVLVNIIGFPTALVGVILGHVAYVQGKAAGFKNTFALVAIYVGWGIVALTVLGIGLLVLIGIIAGGS